MKRRPLCLACIGLMIALWVMKLAGFPVCGEPAVSSAVRGVLQERTEIHVRGQIYRRERKTNSFRYYLKNTILLIKNQEIPLGTIYVTARTGQVYPVGGEVLAAGTLEMPEKARNPGQFDARSYYACQKIYYCLWAEKMNLEKDPAMPLGETMARLQEALTERTAEVLPGSQAGILAAMLWGDKSLLEEDTRINYQYGGVSHVLSISGLHVSLMGMAVYRLIRRLLPFEIPAAAAAALCMLGYCLFTGMQVATIRAFLMFAAGLGARLTGRSYDMLCALALAGILILLENPGMLFYSGFQLSFTAVLGIALVCPAVLALLPRQKKAGGKFRQCMGKILENVCSCSLIWGVTLPLTAYYFYEIPLWSSLLNLLMLPFMGVLMILGLAGAAAAFLWMPAGKILLLPVGLLLEGFERVMELLRHFPGGLLICGQPRVWQVAACYGGIALAVFWCRRLGRTSGSRRFRNAGWMPAAALGLWGLLLWNPRPAFSLTALDVGQGDCLALQAGGVHFLVDGGSSDVSRVGKYRILPYLKQQGIRCLEGVFLTHPDLDHMNGIQELLESIAARETQLEIRQLFLPEWMRKTPEEEKLRHLAEAGNVRIRSLRAGDGIRFGGCRIEVLYPGEGQLVGEGEENGASLVLGIRFGEMDFLLTGDLEGEGEETLQENLGSYEYLKVAHHGSRNSTSPRFLAKVQPEICVISAPEHSLYGHPHEEVLERLRDAGAHIFCTAKTGAVRAVSRGNGIEVFTFLPECDIL